MVKQIVGSMSEWSGVLKDIFRQFDDGSLTLEHAKAFKDHQNPFESVPAAITVAPVTMVTVLPNLNWQKAYGELGVSVEEFNQEVALLNIQEQDDRWIPPVLKIFRREKKKDIPIMTPNRIVEALKRLGKEYDFTMYQSRDDLDKEVTVNARDPNCDGSYAIKFLRAVEPEKKPQLMSYAKPEEFVVSESTLLEELLLQLAYFVTTGQHLTVKEVTRCGASRFRDGSVPSVLFSADDRGVCVDEWDPGRCYDFLLARSPVSVLAEQTKSA